MLDVGVPLNTEPHRGEPVTSEYRSYTGLDVHKETIAVAFAGWEEIGAPGRTSRRDVRLRCRKRSI